MSNQVIEVKPIDISIITKESQEVSNLVANIGSLVIKTQDEYVNAGDLRTKMKGKIKQLEETRKGITNPLDVAKKAVMDLFRGPIDLLTGAVARVDGAIITYTTEQERKAQEEQARLNRIAEKQRREAQEKAEAARLSGNEAKAEKYQEKAATVVAPVVTASTPKVAGQGLRDQWYGEVTDFAKLPDTYKMVNQSALDKVAQALKEKAEVPGVVFKSRKIVSGRSV